MTKITKLLLLCAAGWMLNVKMNAQLSGTYNIPANYSTLSAAIAALNAQGISGPVMIEITAGYTETAPAGGYSLTATGTALNSITFRKTGTGPNPLLTAQSGVATPASATQDGVWRLIGSDYITIDGIDIKDANTTNPATMEYGFGLFKANTSNGCQNNTIRNCVISLKTVNNATGSGPAVEGSRGINMVNSLFSSQTTVITPVSFAGTNSSNKFYANTIKNCNVGVALIGYAAPAPFTLADTGNDVGGTSTADGNTIVNFGGSGGATNPATGIRTLAQYDLNVSYNTLNNNDGTGANHVTTLRGIYLAAALSAEVSITSNTITLNSAGTTAQMSAIENLSGATASNNTVSITYNLIRNCSNATNTSGSFFGIFNNGASASNLEISNNRLTNINTHATSGANYLIYNTGAVPNAITITNNQVDHCANIATTSGAYYTVFNNISSTAVLNVSNNTFSDNTSTSATGATYLIYNGSATSNSIILNNNAISNCVHSISSTGAFYGLFNNGASPATLEMKFNSFINNHVNAFSGSTYLFYNTAAIANSISLQNNLVSGCTSSITSGGMYYGIYNNAASSAVLDISNNTFSSNINTATNGSLHVIYNRGSATNTFVTSALTNNLISGCSFSATSNAPFLGIYNSGVTSGSLSLSNNTLTGNTWAMVSGAKYLVYNTGPVSTTLDLNNNLIANCTSTNNTTGSFNGISNSATSTVALNMCGNTFSVINNTSTTGSTYLMLNSGAVPGGVITITNNAVSDFTNIATALSNFYGISNTGTTFSDLTVTHNTYSNNFIVSLTGAANFIYNAGTVNTTINNITMSDNLITGNTTSITSSGAFYGIYNNGSSCVNLAMSANTFSNHACYAVNGANHLVYNRGAITNTFSSVSLDNNLISGCTFSSSAGAGFYSLWNNGVTTTLTSISNNTITDSWWRSATALRYLISNWGVAVSSANISGNLISGCTHTNNTTGALFGIYNNANTAVSSGALLISNNTFTNNTTTATTGETHHINSTGVITNTFSSITIANNILANCTSAVNGSGAFFGIYNNTASTDNLNISGNAFTGAALTSSNGSTYFMYNRGVAGNLFASVTASNNLLSGLTHFNNTNSTLYGFVNTGVATTKCALLSVVNNTFMNSVSSGTSGGINLLNNTCPVTASISISTNLFSDITNTVTTTGSFYAINNSGASSSGDLSVTDNVFRNLISTATSGSHYLVYNSGGITNSVTITGNLISGCSHSVSAGGTTYGLYNNSSISALSVNLSSNTFSDNFSGTSSGNTYLLANAGSVNNTITSVSIVDNLIDAYTHAATSGIFYGIYNSGFTSERLGILTNTLSNITLTTNANQQLIYNNAKVTNTISIAGNLITACTNTSNAGSFYGVVNSVNFANTAIPQTISITANSFLNNNLNAAGGAIYWISNTGAVSNTIATITIESNLFSGLSNTTTGNGNFFGVYNTAISSESLSIQSNSFTTIASTSTASSRYMIYNGGPVMNTAELSGNTLSDITAPVNANGTYYGINNGGASPGEINMRNNTITDHTLSATSGSGQFIYNSGIISGSLNITNNLLSGITHSVATSGGFYGVYNNAGSSANVNLSTNTFTNLSASSVSGVFYVLYNRVASSGTVNTLSISNNLAADCSFTSTSGQFIGVFNTATFASLSVENNTFVNIAATTTTAARYFFYNSGVGTTSLSINNNFVSGFTSTLNTTGSFYGATNSGIQLGDLSITNNRFLNHELSATTGSVFAIYNTGATTNTIRLENNLFSGVTHSAATTGGFLGFCNNTTSSASLSISGNTLTNASLFTTSGATHFIYNRGAATSTIASISMLNNVIGTITHSATSGPFYGAYNNATTFSNLNIGGNAFSNITSTTSTSARYFFYNTGISSGTTSIASNTVSNYTSLLNTSGVFYNVVNTGASAFDLNISGNTFSAQVLPSTTGAAYMIYNTGLISGSVTIGSNLVSGLTHSSTTGVLYGIYNNGVLCTDLSLSSNTLSAITTTNLVSVKYLIYNTSAASNNIRLNNNHVSNYSAPANTTGTFSAIYNTGSPQANFEANGNQIDGLTLPATTGTCYVIYNTGTVSGTSSYNNNLLSNITHSTSGAGTFFGIYNLASASPLSLSMSGNTFSNSSVSVPTVAIYLIYNAGTSTTSINSINMDNNSVAGFTNVLGSGTFYGIYNNNIPSVNLSLSGNTFTDCVSTTTGSTRYLVYNTGTVSSNMSFVSNRVGNYSSPLNTTADFYGIYNSALCGGNLDMSGNTLENNFLESTTGANYLVYNSAAVGNGISMNNNTIAGNTNSNTTSGNFYGVYNTGTAPNTLAMNGNTVNSNISNATTGDTYLLYNAGVITNSVYLSSNTLGQSFANSSIDYSGTLYHVYNTGGAVTTTLTVLSNTFLSSVFTGLPGSGSIYFIHNTTNNKRYDIAANVWNGLSMNHNGSEYLMYNPSSTFTELNVKNNSVNGYTRTANAGAMYLYYSNGSSPAGCTQIITGNSFSGISAGTQGTGSFYGIYNMDGSGTTYPKKTVYNNTITNVNYNGLGFFYGYYLDFLGDGSSAGSAVYNNTLSVVTWGGPFYGLYVAGNVSSGFAADVHSNLVQASSTSGTTAELYGAYLMGGGNGLNFYKNKISDLTASGTLGKACGIHVATAASTSIYNNLIGNIFTPSTSAADPLNGIHVAGGTQVNLYYNTVNLNAASTGGTFGSNALSASASVSLTVRNNIFINTSAFSGNGVTTAYNRSSASLANYAIGSGNNNFYTGIPSANRLIYTDGTNSYQTLPAYQAYVAPRDNASVSEDTPFLSTVGTNTNFLHVDFTVPSLTESGALAISGITDDVDSEIRQGNPGYIGTGTAPDIGADEYEQNLIPCSSANAGTAIIPSSAVTCDGETVYMLTTGSTAAGNIVRQWQVATLPGGPYTNVTGGIGANTTAYTTANLVPGNYYFVLTTTCTNGPITGTSNVLPVTVNTAPSATAAVALQTVCSGADLNFTGSSNSGITYTWTGPNNFTSTVQNPTVSNVVTNSGGTYTLLVSDASCTSSAAFVNVTVHPTPPSFSLTPPAASICVGGSQTLTASIPISSPTLNFGSQTNQNTASGAPAPYSVYYGGQKMQILILAGELSAAGFTVGTPIQSIQFPVSALGPNWNSTLFECQNFMVGIKATNVAALSVFETNLSNVVAAFNFTPTVGFANIHNFSAPFIWDGSSNLVIETVFSNSITGTAGNTVIQYNTPTGFQSTLVYRADNQNVSVIAAASTSNTSVGFVRPAFKLNSTQVGNYSWSPAAGLSATSGVSVVASPTASSIYSVALSDGQCASDTTVSIDVILNPTITISTSASTVCLGNTATLTVGGADSYTWNSGATQTSIVVAPFSSTTYSVTGANSACPTATAGIFITLAPALSLTATASPAVLCESGTSTLNVSGASTYTWTGGANTTSIIVSPAVTTNYTVTAFDGPGCWASKVVNVKVNPLPVVTATPAAATICLGESVTFEASGVFNFTWSPGGANSPIFTVSPASSATFEVLGVDQNNCANTATVSITVEACTGIAAPGPVKTISVFPNPTRGLLTADFGYEGRKEIHVENTLGAVIYTAETTAATHRLDLSGFAKGIYFVKIKSLQHSGTYKIVVD